MFCDGRSRHLHGSIYFGFDLFLRKFLNFGHFADDQVPGLVQHSALPIGKAFRGAQNRQAFQDLGENPVLPEAGKTPEIEGATDIAGWNRTGGFKRRKNRESRGQ